MKEVCRREIRSQGPLSNHWVSFPWPCEPGLEDNLLETNGSGRTGRLSTRPKVTAQAVACSLRKCFLQTLMFPNVGGEAVIKGLLV